MTNSNNGDTEKADQTEEPFTEREIEQVLQVAEELDQIPINPARGLAATQVKIVGAIIVALVAIIAFQYLRPPNIVEQPSATFFDAGRIMVRQRAVQNDATCEVSHSLGALQDAIQPLENLSGLADKIALAVNDGAMRKINAAKDALEALAYVPRVVNNATKDLKTVTQFSKTINCLLKESLGMIESEALRVPKDAHAALVHFQDVLEKLQMKLDSVLTLINDITLKMEERLRFLVLMKRAVDEVAQALKGDRAWIRIPFFKAVGDFKNELAWLQELSSQMTTGAPPEMENAVRLFSDYAEMLQLTLVDKIRSQDTKKDEFWVNVVVLQTWTRYGQPELVAPQVLRNLEILLELLERVQIG
ncbi:hypothetical protein IWX46DRAFT_630656 [Phyllosticta citricarpa]